MNAGFLASSIVRTLVLPPASLFILAAIGWILHRRWPRLGRAVIILSMAVLFFLCTGIGSDLLVSPLENMTEPLVKSRDTRAQAIVVLAAGRLEHAAEYGGKDIPDYIALGRLRYAAKLQHETGLPILVSGGNVASDGAMESKADAMARALREDFHTPVRWIEGASENTAQNAQFSANIFRQDRVHRILLVTDAMHMPRAKLLFAQAGLDVVPAPTLFFGDGSVGVFDFLPSAEGLRRSNYAIYEWIGLLGYWILNVGSIASPN
jgi:uncharacterized SAM-binding protein YcdF (DUF218 family)